MRFFSRIVLICNICFLIVVALHFLRLAQKADNIFNGTLVYQPLISTIAVLGYLVAIFLNMLFIFLSIYWIKRKKIRLIPLWIVIANLLIFPLQVYFHFFMK
jgi:hypothetical protein